MSAPKWAVGMRMLAPGIYQDAKGSLHVNPERVLRSLNIPVTERTMAMFERVMAEEIEAKFGKVPTVEHVDTDEEPYAQ